MRLGDRRGLDLEHRVGLLCGGGPVGERVVFAIPLWPHEADHSVREVVLDVGDAEEVLTEQTHRAAAEIRAGDDEVDVLPCLIDARQRKGSGACDLRTLPAADTFDVEVVYRVVDVQLQGLHSCRLDGAEERTTVGDEQGILAVDLRTHHRYGPGHRDRDIRKAGNGALAGVHHGGTCNECEEGDRDGSERMLRRAASDPPALAGRAAVRWSDFAQGSGASTGIFSADYTSSA